MVTSTTSSRPLRIATRKSALALWQAREVQQRLRALDVPSELIEMSTRGDEILDTPLAKIGGKGLFIKELQKGMLQGHADLAVHSMKDLPAEFPESLHLSVVLDREDPSDALVSNNYKSLDELPQGAVVGTCSLRRQCQLKYLRSDLTMKDLRGNVNTRLKKLDEGQFDAIVLASAGLIRLGMSDRIATRLPLESMLPACGQGIVGIECKVSDDATNAALAALHDRDAFDRVTCERSLNARLGGSCTTPIASYSELEGDQLYLRAMVGMPDGSALLRASGRASRTDAYALGNHVAEKLLDDGADRIIASFQGNAKT